MVRTGVFILLAAVLGACGTTTSNPKEITGNNTGGTIPPLLAQGADVQQLANEHCARWGNTAQITFDQKEFGGEVVFICVGPDGEPVWIQRQPSADAAAADA